jgi:ABC-type oligopeptide transport system substrate-binding subunit
MIFSGLVRSDRNMNVIPDQATWDVSSDNRTYTFHLKPNIFFSDGTPVTAQSYVYSWNRALLPALNSTSANLYEAQIAGYTEMSKGKAKSLSGLKALDSKTLQVKLTHPVAYFLQTLTNPVFYPINKKLIDLYGQTNWTQHVVGTGVGTGPFVVSSWQHNIKMVFTPNMYYYGAPTKLKTVNMIFADDPSTAFKSYRAGQFDFMWNLTPQDEATVSSSAGFVSAQQLVTDGLFFNVKSPPFDNPIVRQAFAYATDRDSLAHTIFQDSVIPATTLLPTIIPGYSQTNTGLAYNKARAQSLLQSVYPDAKQVPPIVFSYSSSQVSNDEAMALQTMWNQNLGIKVSLRAVEQNAFNDESSMHQIQFGFTQWSADFPDPNPYLARNLLSTATSNSGQWSNQEFDHLANAAEQTTDGSRMALYAQAEQVALNDAALVPLDFETLAGVIPSTVHGVTLNGQGLYFGDWSQVTAF